MTASKKIFIVILILFILAGSSLAVYNLFLKSGQGPADNGSQGTPQNPLNLEIKPIGFERSFALAIGQDNQSVKYYLAKNGHAQQSDFKGQNLSVISQTDLPGLTGIIWSPDRKKVISIFDKQIPPKKYFYSYETKKGALLNENIRSVAWSPDSQKIVYQFRSPDGATNNISIANADGTNWRNLLQTRMENVSIAWPSPDKIYIWDKPSGLVPGSLFALDPASGNLSKVLSGIYGLSAKFSPDGQKMIYQTTDQDGKNLKLFAVDSKGGQPKDLSIVTLVDKCVWSPDSQIIFCAVPQSLLPSAILPDYYLEGKIMTKDDFYIVDTSTVQKTKIASSDSQQSVDARELILSPTNNYLFFISQSDGLVYSLAL